MVLSFSNLESLTHWWNLTSSSSTLLLFPRPVDSNKTWKMINISCSPNIYISSSHLVIETQPELRHAREVDSHLDVAPDLRPEDIALSSSQQVNTLDDVQEDFILPVLDAFWCSPGHGVSDGWGRFWGSDVQFVSLLGDVLLQRQSLECEYWLLIGQLAV